MLSAVKYSAMSNPEPDAPEEVETPQTAVRLRSIGAQFQVRSHPAYPVYCRHADFAFLCRNLRTGGIRWLDRAGHLLRAGVGHWLVVWCYHQAHLVVSRGSRCCVHGHSCID